MTELTETNKILKKPWTKQHEKTYTRLYNYMNDKCKNLVNSHLLTTLL